MDECPGHQTSCILYHIAVSTASIKYSELILFTGKMVYLYIWCLFSSAFASYCVEPFFPREAELRDEETIDAIKKALTVATLSEIRIKYARYAS